MNEVLFIFIVFFGFLFVGMPVAFALGGAAVITLVTCGYPVGIIASRALDAVDKWVFLAIPLFIFLGALMNTAGVTEKLIDFSNKVLGHVSGGLSHVNVATSMLLAGMSGSTLADAAGVGKILIPSMKEEGYSGGYAAAMTAISAVIGSIIPPSINFIVVGSLGNISILRMWVGGVIPGIIVGITLMVAGYFINKRKRYAPSKRRAPLREVAHSAYYASPALVVPIVVLGGMRLGFFTPTEGAAVGVMYVAGVGFFVYRQLNTHLLLETAWDTARSSGGILWFIAMGTLFGTVLFLAKASEIVAPFVLGITQSKIIFLLVVSFVLLILGCVMEIMPVILIMLPITLPLAIAFGVDPVHFGVLFGFISVVGQSTPPVGLTMYITVDIAECSVEEYVKEGWILWVPMIVCIILFIFFPQLILWLPNLVMGPVY